MPTHSLWKALLHAPPDIQAPGEAVRGQQRPERETAELPAAHIRFIEHSAVDLRGCRHLLPKACEIRESLRPQPKACQGIESVMQGQFEAFDGMEHPA